MTISTFAFLLFCSAILAGFLGSLTGLGGGGILIPILTLLFKVDIHYAIGTSLVSAIAISSGAATTYVNEGITNIRLGIFLEVATTMGAITGAYLAIFTPTNTIAIVFGIVLIISSISSFLGRYEKISATGSSKLAVRLKLPGELTTSSGTQSYAVKNVVGGFAVMQVAGIISGLAGIGAGALKVIAMDGCMRVPFKVSTATSNFMIGVTAVASAGIYLKRGYIDPALTMPVVLGILVGAFLGTQYLREAKSAILKIVFSILILLVAAEMIYNGITHSL